MLTDQMDAVFGVLSARYFKKGVRSPEQESQGLEEGLEVVVVIYGSLLVQLNVSKHLRRAGGSYRKQNSDFRVKPICVLLMFQTSCDLVTSLIPSVNVKVSFCILIVTNLHQSIENAT